jgi:hypothetical protein
LNALGDFPCGFPAASLRESLGVLIATRYVFDIKTVIGEGSDCFEPEKNFSPSFPEWQGI